MYLLFVVTYAIINVKAEYNLFGYAGQAYSIAVNIGHPPQKLSVLVDTGSTTFAIASCAESGSDKYFASQNSSSLYNSGKMVQAKYSQGMWQGLRASDFVQFPSLVSVPEVSSDIALITKSHNFFMNGSNWQGLLGLAYLPVAAWDDNVILESWLDSVNNALNKPISFLLNLCGVQSPNNSTHYGKFEILDDKVSPEIYNDSFRTPILRKRWYEVGVLSVRILESGHNLIFSQNSSDIVYQKQIEECQKLNEAKSIVDSGTTNIRLPNAYFREVVDRLRNAAKNSNVFILDDFWYHSEAACWPEPHVWSLPWLAIDLLSAESDQQYFTLELPPKNYMRVVSAHNNTAEKGIVSEYCYKLGIEAGGRDTVLGYTAMEGLQVIFNRSAGWISWKTSDCGPDARITGPYNASISLPNVCQLIKSAPDVAVSIKAAQWALCAVSIVAAGVLLYLLGPCVKMFLIRPPPTTNLQVTLSQTALVDQEST